MPDNGSTGEDTAEPAVPFGEAVRAWAAVVGVIANLGAWFGVQVLFAERATVAGLGARVVLPVPATLDPATAAIAVATGFALSTLGQSVPRTLVAAALVGAAWRSFVG